MSSSLTGSLKSSILARWQYHLPGHIYQAQEAIFLEFKQAGGDKL